MGVDGRRAWSIDRSRRLVVAATLLLAVSIGPGAHVDATWSIIGVDEATGEVGVAVASCVGFEVTAVPVLVPGVGAAASQADIAERSGERFLESMIPGATAADVLDAVVAADDAADDRQFGVVVLDDAGAGWTGTQTIDVAVDERNADGTAAAQGNILAATGVVSEALAAFDATPGPLSERLLAALVSGADAGGDRRCGEQTATAAALMVASVSDAPYAETDAGVFGVDPDSVEVPSVFVSVLVNRGDERAPDRLVEIWAAADRSEPVLARVIDDGADTAATRARRLVLVIGGILVVGLAAGTVALIRSRRNRA